MARITLKRYVELPLYDPEPSKVHIRDLVQKDELYSSRISSHTLGMLLMGVAVGAIQRTQACYFRAALLPHVRIRKLYYPEGRPFLGPDGTSMSVQGFSLIGDPEHGAILGGYTLETVAKHPDFEDWLAKLLYCGGDPDDAEYLKQGLTTPRRRSDGSLLEPERSNERSGGAENTIDSGSDEEDDNGSDEEIDEDDENAEDLEGSENDATDGTAIPNYVSENIGDVDIVDGVPKNCQAAGPTPTSCKRSYPQSTGARKKRARLPDTLIPDSPERPEGSSKNSILTSISDLQSELCSSAGSSNSGPAQTTWTRLWPIGTAKEDADTTARHVENLIYGPGQPIAYRAASGGHFDVVVYRRAKNQAELNTIFGLP